MLLEINQVKQFLADTYPQCPRTIVGGEVCVMDVPDCEHMIPLGVSHALTRVVVKGERIYIDPRPSDEERDWEVLHE